MPVDNYRLNGDIYLSGPGVDRHDVDYFNRVASLASYYLIVVGHGDPYYLDRSYYVL